MARTLLEVVQNISRPVGLDPAITAFADDDETNDLVQYINEAYEYLIDQLPEDTTVLNQSATITTAASTRLYNLASDASWYRVHGWSLQNRTDDAPIHPASKEFVTGLDPDWDTTEGQPQYMYPDDTQVAFYPVPDGVYSIEYQYGQDLTARLSTTTDTFLVPDRWLRFIELFAQERYENAKGYTSAEMTMLKARDALADILIEIDHEQPTYFYSGDFN